MRVPSRPQARWGLADGSGGLCAYLNLPEGAGTLVARVTRTQAVLRG